jgi:hypothetical protein
LLLTLINTESRETSFLFERGSIVDNPLYNLQNKKTLAALLFYDEAGYMLQDIPFINNYNVFILENKLSNGEKKQRIVETPQGMLKTIHNRIFKFLNRLDLPDYLISKKNSSYINNHLVHKQNSHILTMDISKFYPMCSFAKVNWFFLNSMKMSEDTSYIISKILTINYDEMKIKEDVQTYFDSLKKNENIVFPREHIPTGSSVSNILSFLSYKDMFDKIYTLSLFRNIKMTVYVDDLTFSSDRKIPSEYIHEVKRIIKHYGHK